MNSAIDIGDLVQINKMLSNYISKLITERAELYNSYLDILNNRAVELNNNKIELTGLLKEIEWVYKICNRHLLNEWKRTIAFQHLKIEDTETLEFESWVVATVEAYKTALSATCLTNFTCRDILMDQKNFLQRFLIDLIKYHDLYSEVKQPALLV